jgi:hypothetical protein
MIDYLRNSSRGRRFAAPACAGLLLGVLLGGCGSGSVSNPDMTAPADLVPFNFIGYWGIKAKVVQIQMLPFLGATQSTNTMLGVGQFRMDGMGNLVMDQTECRVTVKSANAGITTDVPDKIADTTPVLTGKVTVVGGNNPTGFSRAQVALGIGCHLNDPFNDALPTSTTDTRVFDQDMDTNPGVTVNPQTPVAGSVYVVERRKYSYDMGQIASGSRLTGQITDRSEQYIMDATNPMLKSQIPTTPVDNMSVFEMDRLSTQYDCTRLKAEAGTLFKLQ